MSPTGMEGAGEQDVLVTRLRDVLAFVRNNYGLMLAVAGVCVLTTYLALVFVSDQYETELKVLVKLGRETLDPPPLTRGTPTSMGLRREDLASEMQIMKSSDLIAGVVKAVGPDAFRPKPPTGTGFFGSIKATLKSAVRELRNALNEVMIALNLKKRLTPEEEAENWLTKNLEVQVEKDSDVIAIRLRSADPRFGEMLLEKWMGLYLARRLEVRQSGGVKEFMDAEVQQAQRDLAEKEAARNAWKSAKSLSATSVQKEALIRSIRELGLEQTQVSGELAAVRRELQSTRDLLAKVPVDERSSQVETSNPTQQLLRDRLATLEGERARLLTKYQPESEKVSSVQAEIARVQEMLKSEPATKVSSVSTSRNTSYKKLEENLRDLTVKSAGLESKNRELTRKIAALSTELKGTESADARLAALERDRAIAENRYLALLKEKQEADISIQLDKSRISNVSSLGPARSSFEPVYPKRLLALLLAIPLGLLLGAGCGLVREYVNKQKPLEPVAAA